MAWSQADTAAIGGPEVVSPYEEDYASPYRMIEGGASAEDSARVIPGYTTYGDFDTDAIFERQARAKRDTAILQLAFESCDHRFPTLGAINSPFGPRHGRMHYGLDIELESGDAVLSAFEGLVRISRFHQQFGNVIVVRHANGLETLYGHLSERLVETGDHVEAGDLIGLGGSTGRSTGSHLHFETRYLGQPIDPQLLFDARTGDLRSDTLMVHPGLFTLVDKQKARARAGREYRVRRGDTLSSIAHRYKTTVSSLCSTNKLTRRSKLRVGQRLHVK
jgi:murein DD-endopeptidase MepM/ murein hydrolase activator NlpD